MASELRVNTLKDASGNNSVAMSTVAQGSAKAWATVNASTGTPTLLDNHNVSSVSDEGQGVYDVNFTSNFWGNTSYATTCAVGQGGNKNAMYDNTATSSIEIQTEQATTGTNNDYDHSSSVHHGDLA
jgi:hypothetical protein